MDYVNLLNFTVLSSKEIAEKPFTANTFILKRGLEIFLTIHFQTLSLKKS